MAKMNDDELRQVIDAEVSEASAFSGSSLAAEREQNLNYYYGRPMGNEVEGRSQVVSWDVFEVIESTIPSLLEPFFAGDDIGEFEPVSPEDEQYAEQASDYINHIIKKKNDGFITFNTWIKDGLLSKVGIVRAWWDATEKTRKQSYTGLTEQQLTKFTEDPKVTITAADTRPDPEDEKQRAQAQEALATMDPEQAEQVMQQLAQPGKMLYDIDTVVNNGPRGARIDNVPPETFVLSRHAKKLADVSMIGEFRQYTRSDLVEMGYSKAQVAELSEYDMPHSMHEISLRNEDEQSIMSGDNRDDAMEKLWLFFGFVRADVDGDGIAEWRRVLMGGNAILENEEVDDHEYCLWSPILLPHRIIGMALADAVVSIQDQKTSLTRLYLDSLHIANSPTTYALDGQVNIDDLLSNRIGKIIRMKQLNAVGPIQQALVANESLQGLELMDTARENRTGVSRLNSGLDADSLNKTATGATIANTRDQKREKMILRVFAETGCKDLFKRLLRLTCTYQDKAATVKMRNEWVEYDPRNWSDEMDVSIAVGLGTSDKQADIAFLGMMAPYFAQVQPMGIFSKQNAYNLGKFLMKKGGIQGADKLLTDPSTVPEQPPAKSPEQTLAEAELQIEQMRQQGKAAEAAQKMELSQAQLEADTVLQGISLQIKEKEVRIKEIDLGMKEMEMHHRMSQDERQAGREQQERDDAQAAGDADAGQKDQMLHLIQGLYDKIEEVAQLETHIVRGEDGRASHSVKRRPAPPPTEEGF
jgi:hypothetical protein